MKKLLFSVIAALTMSFSVSAQTASMQRVDVRNYKVLPRTSNVPSPDRVMTDLVSEKTNHCLFDAKDDYANAYGFVVFDWRYKTNAVINFTTDAVSDYRMQVNYGQIPQESIGFFCSTFVGDKIFAYCYRYYGPGSLVPISMGYIDPKTGIYEKKFDMPLYTDIVLSDMTYDPETKLCYASEILYEEQKPVGSAIYTIDPTASETTLTMVAKIPGVEMFTLSCDRGNLYSVVPVETRVGRSAKLIKMPISSIKNGSVDVESIGDVNGSLRTNIGWAQSMEFDKINHKLVWFAQTLDDKSFLCNINTEKGTVENKQELSSTVQVVSLSIPYQDVAKAAPSYVRNLKGEAASEGKNKVTISWTNPTKNFDLGELSSLTKVNIIRDGETIATVDATGIGQAQTYEDTTVGAGIHIYKVQPVNGEGNGVYKEFRLFVGHDTPAGPGAVKVNVDAANPCHATITWAAPGCGENGGWIDKSSLKYDVVRYPGEVKIASDITECKAEDNVEVTEGYYYVITSKNNDGVGGTSQSEVTVFGPGQTVPYFTPLTSIAEFNKWTVLDNNHDMTTWNFNTIENVPCYDRGEGPADDYFVSPAITFEEGKKYQVRFKYWTINWVNPADHSPILDKMDVYYAQEPTAEAFRKEGRILDLGEFHTPSETYLYAKQVFTAKPGEGHIAFHAYSDANRSIIYLQNVCVREYSATDLSVTDMTGSITVVQDAKAAYTAEVMNEGSARVENYTVDLINKATGEVLATAKGIAVDPEQKQTVIVEWTPKTTGSMDVVVRVNLEGDSYPADNTWSEPISVTINAAGSDTWLSVNKDDSHETETDRYSMGYAIPFNFARAYSMVQSIYLEKEMSKKDISLTGVKFVFDGKNEEDVTADVRVSAQFIDKTFFGYDVENNMVELVDVEDPNWMKLFEGKTTFGGVEKNMSMEIKFDTPYYYEGGNIVFMFERLWDENFLKPAKAPIFHYHEIDAETEEETFRTCQFKSKYEDVVDPTAVGTFPYVPFTMFSYKEGDISGIFGISDNGLNFDLADGRLSMSEICDNIVVYGIDGKVVAEAKNASVLSLGSLHGIYVIKAKAGNKTINAKVNF